MRTEDSKSCTYLSTSFGVSSAGRMLVGAATAAATTTARSVRLGLGGSRMRCRPRRRCLLGRAARRATRLTCPNGDMLLLLMLLLMILRLRLLRVLRFAPSPRLLLMVVGGSSSGSASAVSINSDVAAHGVQVGQRPLDASPGCQGRYYDGSGPRSRPRRRRRRRRGLRWMRLIMMHRFRGGTGGIGGR